MNLILPFPLVLYFLSFLLGNGAQAQRSTSLYIPGFDPQPVSADVIGVGSDGRTTWALHKGKPDPTDTSSYPDFVGTATLVEGPDDAFMTYANSAAQFTIGAGCTFSESTLAICTLVAQSSTATQTEHISRLAIQGGATVSRNPSPTSLSTISSSPGGYASTSALPSLNAASPATSTSSARCKTSKPVFRSLLASCLALVACATLFLA
ncbi:hypothetical protein M413DRAFT_82803 [Hebeloma cylindrosporum]|uniref:Uncharacterized protein n=1 Tax=Hebeloma cylindrosporum TaxID=76867 RepID=A0A0C3CWY7_HEBCY|nr:hypothetical protein M413DRAFT_82803 [Hebeloma cylindrosporum h7]